MHNTCIHFQIGRLINQFPTVNAEAIFRKCLRSGILGSKHTFQKALHYMEEKDIIMNPAVSIKNHSNYANRFYLLEVDDETSVIQDLICRYRDCIDVIFTFSSLRSVFLYIGAHRNLDDIAGNSILEDTIAEYHIVFPCKEHEKYAERVLPEYVFSPEMTQKEPLKWDKKMWEIYYWLKVNFRLYNSEIGRQVGLDPVTVARRRKKMLPSLIVHYPLFAEGHDNYHMLLFILENDFDRRALLSLLSDLSGMSYVLKGRKGEYLCFASARNRTFSGDMKRVMKNESLRFAHLWRKWTPILDDYEKGKIEERFFYMFPPQSELKRSSRRTPSWGTVGMDVSKGLEGPSF